MNVRTLESVKPRSVIIILISIVGLQLSACGPPPEKAVSRPASITAEKKQLEPKKTVRTKHLSGEVLAVNTKAKTITVRSKDHDIDLRFDDKTVVRLDLETVKPSAIPIGARATIKFIDRRGESVARGIFMSTETAEKKDPPQSFFRTSA